MSETVNIEQHLKKRKEELSGDLDFAIEHAWEIKLVEGKTDPNTLQKAQEIGSVLKSLSPDTVVNVIPLPAQENKVYLDHRESHLYPWLIRELLLKLVIQRILK